MAELETTYAPAIERAVAAAGTTPAATGAMLEAVAAVLATEAERLRAETHGGMIDDAYVAPLGDVSRAQLTLATGAPRLNLGTVALGQQVRMVAETAATRLTLHAASAAEGELIRATFTGPAPDVRTAGGTVNVRYRRRLIDTRSREVHAALHPSPAWGIAIDGGITDLDADLTELRFLGLEVRGGANHLRLQLPRPSGTVRIAVDGGSSDARITRPAGVPVALVAPGGVSRLRFDGRTRHSSGTEIRVRSDGYDHAPDRYEIELAGGISDLRIGEA